MERRLVSLMLWLKPALGEAYVVGIGKHILCKGSNVEISFGIQDIMFEEEHVLILPDFAGGIKKPEDLECDGQMAGHMIGPVQFRKRIAGDRTPRARDNIDVLRL